MRHSWTTEAKAQAQEHVKRLVPGAWHMRATCVWWAKAGAQSNKYPEAQIASQELVRHIWVSITYGASGCFAIKYYATIPEAPKGIPQPAPCR